MSTSFRKQTYTQAFADYRDFEGFLKEMGRALRLLGIYVVGDPALTDMNMYGVIFHQGPIDPKALWQSLKKDYPGVYVGRFRDHKETLTPSSLYEKGDIVVFRSDVAHHKDPACFTITELAYSVVEGWLYTLDYGKPFRGVREDLLILRVHAQQD